MDDTDVTLSDANVASSGGSGTPPMEGEPATRKPAWLVAHREVLTYGLLVAVAVVIALAAPHGGSPFGAWSLLPPLALFAFVLVTRRVIEGFVWGTVLAVFMVHRGDLMTAFNNGLFEQLAKRDNLWLVVVLLSIGALVAVLDRSGLSLRFGEWAAGLAKSGRAASAITLLVSLFLSQDGYLSISTTGPAMSGANERVGRPRLFTAYLIRTGAIPGSAFNPLATASVFVAGLLVINGHVEDGNQVGGYAALIPFMFFPMASVLVAFLAAFGVIPPLGAMRRAFTEQPAPAGASAEAPESSTENPKPRLVNFFLTLAVLVSSTLMTGSFQLALLITLVVCAVLFVVQGYFTAETYLEAVIDGMKDMLSLVLIMALAFVFVAALGELGFTDYIVSGVSGSVPAALLPGVIFLLFGVTEFLVTLNWSLYLLALPVVIPLATQTGANTNLVIAAVVSAGFWGATACITSDIGLLNAYTTKTDVFRHWVTNLPYQFVAWTIAAVAFFVTGAVLA